MYIKSIKVQGFKSFADKLELDLSSGMCAIVGPNGSGKSNVVDAILWVLGEQSVKSLRGDSSMSDVIFSGSKTREEQKKASVAILFDNSDHRLNTEFNEVEIKRVIYRSGENEYFINNARVRLKDITDLLIDVTSKFNIISQGNINALVENKSSERRILFESAAGVLKYKKRKEESLKKLEGTKENLTRVNLIIKELMTTLKPLEKQKDDATKYISIKKELEDVEISLIAHDVTNLTNKYEKLKNENQSIQRELDSLDLAKPEELEKLKLENIKIDEKIADINKKILELSDEISALNSQKQINLERAKYKLDKDTIDTNLLSLNEEKLNLERNIEVLSKELDGMRNEFQQLIKEYNAKSDEELKTKVILQNCNNEYNRINKEILVLQNKINIENSNLENNVFLPRSVSSIINNPRLEGIHNTIGNVIDINEAHTVAINTALGANSNFIIVDNMNCAKEAINYLKENRLGRATFFPIDTIKSRHISKDIEYTLASLPGFIGVASDLVDFDSKYQDIIENQLGNVLVVDTIDDLFSIAKVVEHKYKMVSLEGEIIYPGGSIAGGNTSKETHDRSTLNKLKKELENKKVSLENINISIKAEDSKYDLLVEATGELNRKIAERRMTIEAKDIALKDYRSNLESVIDNIKGLGAIDNNDVDNRVQEILEQLNLKQKEKDLCEVELRNLQSSKFDLSNEIVSLEKMVSEQNSHYHKLENTIKNNEVDIAKYEVRIDNLLNILSSDYNISYEYANNNYSLNMEIEVARNMVSKLKSELKGLTNVNLGSIDEYDRLKRRYDFLDKQRNDLETSSNELLNVISEMDDIMKDKFKTTFDQISKEFSKVFRIMFKGGNGLLKLADEEDLLNTGINILAVPPGKKLNSTASLSGGEKALTAICLIFAILNVKPVPFIVLDEAEAALDEENVNMFGEYLSNMKAHSQFILITHKKKMMEYADILYGVTMQESGVSKLVSVKLEDAK
ncbi:MAG: AAA family ATPase [Bacilli bacterium]|nr:AAA family ATPase [Bacilli bacterium]